MCCNCSKSCGVNGTVLTLCVKVLMKLYLAPTWWLLPQCIYWSVLVGFLQMLVVSLSLWSGVNNMSKNGIEPFSLVSSTVNLMAMPLLAMLLRWQRNCLLCSMYCIPNVSSTYLFHSFGGFCTVLSAWSLKYFMYILAIMGLTEEPMAVLFTCS